MISIRYGPFQIRFPASQKPRHEVTGLSAGTPYFFAKKYSVVNGVPSRVMIAVEEHLLRQRPDLLLVYGDVNSTLAATLAAVKLEVPVAHVEAGLRPGDRSMPAWRRAAARTRAQSRRR